MLGLSRNTWFLVGGVMLVVVLYFGFSGGDDDAKKDDATAQAKKGKKRRGKGKRDKTRGGESGGVGVGKMCAKIDCSEAQLASFRGMVKEHRKNTSSQRRGLAEAHAKMAAELAEDTIDTDALDEAFEDATAHRAEMDNSARGVLEAMHAKLSAAQRESLAKMVARHGPALLLSRPSAGASRSTSKSKPKAKKSRRKKGKKQRAQPLPHDALGESGAAPAKPPGESEPEPAGESDPASAGEFSRAPRAGLAPRAAPRAAAALDEPEDLDPAAE